MGRLFGTDGVRGIANQQLTCELAFSLGRAATKILTQGKHRARILIGRDTRISGDMLEAALCAGITSLGGSVELIGVLPTPALAYLTEAYGMDAGVMISASHNTMEYNGIKWVDSQGYKLPDTLEDEIEAMVRRGFAQEALPTGADIGVVRRCAHPAEDYVRHVLSTVDVRLEGMTVVLDCAQGAAGNVAPRVFEELGAVVHCYFDQPDGTNINGDCGSTHPQALQALVLQHGADVGLAFDGDADRLICVDETGALVTGDGVMAICALELKRLGKLKDNTLVTTVMSNLGMHLAMKAAGIQTIRTDVGDRYVLAAMLEHGYNLGGEQSGHVIFSDFAKTGDGILTGVQLLSVMRRTGQKLSQLASAFEILPQVLKNAKVQEQHKYAYEQDAEIVGEMQRITAKYHGNGRVLIRPSGTEAKVRVMLEGADNEDITREATALAQLIEQKYR